MSANQEYITYESEITAIANAIRTKGGTSASMSYPAGFVSAIEAIPSGGSSDGDVIFLDYDGTVVASKTKAEITAMTSDSDLPANPTHTGLTSQGWNWTVVQLKAQLTAMPDQKVYAGQMYVTTSGATEIDVVMHEGRLSPILTIVVNGTISVDWGDNTTPDSVTGSSLTTRLDVSHTYASAGSYTICISKVSGTYSFYGSSSYTLLRKNTTASHNKVYANCIRSIRIGTGVEIIKEYAFYNCQTLASIAIPSSVTNIEHGPFYNCFSLASVTIPSGVTSIEMDAFGYCYSLTSVTIPSGVASIGNTAFAFCYALPSITIPSSVTSIGGSAFSNCFSLASVTIPSGVTSIGSQAFYNCYSLASITIPSGMTSIGTYVFYNCFSLMNAIIPSSVTSIGDNAFYACYSLESITIPDGVKSIYSNAFYSCHSLASITIPSSVTTIGSSAFQYCYGVKEYHIQPTSVPTAGTYIFRYFVSDFVIYVPYSSDHSILNAYKSASNWSSYASYMREEPQS